MYVMMQLFCSDSIWNMKYFPTSTSYAFIGFFPQYVRSAQYGRLFVVP
jgi:hypothetical protein